MKLYYVPKTRASRPRWVLEELGVPYDLVRMEPGEKGTRSAEHLARHPLGHVPVLEDRGQFVFESGAICLHLADLFPEKRLLPPPGTVERAHAYQWVLFAMAEMEPPLVALFAEAKKPEGERSPVVAAQARATFAKTLATLEGALAGRRFLLGDAFSVADVMVGATLAWGKAMKAVDGVPGVEAYLARLRERPAWQRAIAD
ncbi:MAG TPA: glutathione S-transferase family protein [Anaeromyxobacteraceae bacterium]|nr:glutathione S-transferase family protein [Anaeromyxobacteraceae bacterium]